jgi:cupin 2 domain-containing protein
VSRLPGRRPAAATLRTGNIFANVPPRLDREESANLASLPGTSIERIISTGQASPPGFWYDQDWTEWVVLLAGSAGLLIEGEDAPRILAPGDYVEIPPNVRHRVEWTAAEGPTVWLAVHVR